MLSGTFFMGEIVLRLTKSLLSGIIHPILVHEEGDTPDGQLQ